MNKSNYFKAASLPSIAFAITAMLNTAIAQEQISSIQPVAAKKNLYWGDTHLHTSNSFDAFLNSNMSADPETAYNYAKGKPVIHPYHRSQVQINTPLDFLVIADHAELLGVMGTAVLDEIPRQDLGFIDKLKAWYAEYQFRDAVDSGTGPSAFVGFLPLNEDPIESAKSGLDTQIPNTELMSRNTWEDAIQIADRHNQPGKFTTFIGWEWSSIPGGANLHRVVFTDTNADSAAKFAPFSSQTSQYPEDLWQWMDKTSDELDIDFVAIPHNSNISKGFMFPQTTIRNEPIDLDYAKLRSKWEPVAEITQIKGDSETHPALSPDDPFADFETYSYYIEQEPPKYIAGEGDYARSGLKRGLKYEQTLGINPFKFGVIGATDSHTGLASAEESNFHGKMARLSTPEMLSSKRSISKNGAGPSGWSMSASGLAAVWAEENSRQSILAAFKRKEVYATSGPRMMVRLFGGWNFLEQDAAADQIANQGYAKGVPMGGDLPATSDGETAPQFILQAIKDPLSANLDRLQIIKGWIDTNGETQERVHNVAWSNSANGDARSLNSSGQLAEVGNTVNLSNATYTNSIGVAELNAYWQDPDFDPAQRAFYYARVLQIPTPRHTLASALALGLEEAPETPSTIQDRAYTSPIWYTPQ